METGLTIEDTIVGANSEPWIQLGGCSDVGTSFRNSTLLNVVLSVDTNTVSTSVAGGGHTAVFGRASATPKPA